MRSRSTWGEDVILKGFAPKQYRPRNAKAMNYAEVYIISWDGLEEALSDFAASAAHIRRCAVRLAMRRQLVRVANALKRAERTGRPPSILMELAKGGGTAAEGQATGSKGHDGSFTLSRSKTLSKMLHRSTTCAA